MSVNLGIYDFFAYIVPGLMYLFLLNDFSARMGWFSFDLAQANSQIGIGAVGVVALAAYVLGNIFDPLAHWFCFKLLTRGSMPETVLEDLKRQYPALRIAYQPKDYHMLFVLLRARNPAFAQTLDRFESNSIMLKNVSFISALFSVLRLPELVRNFNVLEALLVLAGMVVCLLAYRAGKMYHTWFFLDIFQASLEYGLNASAVLANKKPKQAR